MPDTTGRQMTVYVPIVSIIDTAINEWRKHLRASVHAKVTFRTFTVASRPTRRLDKLSQSDRNVDKMFFVCVILIRK